jgi:long-chain acyl-CoA synthetase
VTDATLPATLPAVLATTVAARGDEPAYSDRHAEDGWRTVTWSEVVGGAKAVAGALIDRGVQPGDTVALMCSNRIEHVLADLGAVHAGAVPMTIYATLAPETVRYIAGHSLPAAVVLEGSDQLARWALALADCPSIKVVVVLDGTPCDDPRAVTWAELLEGGADSTDRCAAIRPDDPLTILYTSGTTGDPKGVVLTHRNVLTSVVAGLKAGGLEEPGISISYLPFAHIAERNLGMYGPQVQGAHVFLVDDPAALPAALGQVHPTRFFGVPRVWEKVMAGVSALLAANPDPKVTAAMATAQAWVAGKENGGTPSAELDQAFAEADSTVLQGIRGFLGLDRLQWAASAAAPMPVEVARFFAGLGIIIYDVYGMTETTGSVTANTPSGFKLGTVGRPLPGAELRLGEDGEIQVRGPVLTPGYLHNPEATAVLIGADGWLGTGDIGVVDTDGYYSVVDRKKEMIITSSGKNIAPSNIENLLKESPLVGHAYAAGDGKSYVVALLTLDPDVAPVVAAKAGIEGRSLAELADHPTIRAILEEAVATANSRLSRPEQVKRFAVLAAEWTAESEELTPTLKLKRRVVSTKYADVLDRLYG